MYNIGFYKLVIKYCRHYCNVFQILQAKINQWTPDMKQRCHIHTHATTVKPYLGIGSSSTIKNS